MEGDVFRFCCAGACLLNCEIPGCKEIKSEGNYDEDSIKRIQVSDGRNEDDDSRKSAPKLVYFLLNS